MACINSKCAALGNAELTQMNLTSHQRKPEFARGQSMSVPALRMRAAWAFTGEALP